MSCSLLNLCACPALTCAFSGVFEQILNVTAGLVLAVSADGLSYFGSLFCAFAVLLA